MPDTVIRILLPTYEPRPDFLRATIDSVTTQTEQRWTLRVNDDASATDVRAIIEPYLKDPRVSFSRNPRRLGLGGNWNACLGVALGAKPGPSYVQFLFQDDLWDSRYLACALRAMEEHPTVGFVSTEHDYDCEEGIASAPLYDDLQRFRLEHIAPGIHRGKELLAWWLERGLHPNIIGEPSFVLMRQCTMEDTGLFDRRMRQNLDVEYWTRMLERNDWYYCAENGGTFRVHKAGASERNRRGGHGFFDRLCTIERVLRRSGKDRQERAFILTCHTAQMMHKRFAPRQGNRPRVPHLLPFLPFVIRHPIVTSRALARAWRLT